MAFDKQALLRYFLINHRLKQSPLPTTEDLRKFVEQELSVLSYENKIISRASIKTDIRTMKKTFLAPINFSFNTNRYQYESNDAKFMEMPQLAIDYFCNCLRLQLLFSKHSQEGVLQYQDRSMAGIDKIAIFAKAIAHRKQISFLYRPFNSKRNWETTIHPLSLKEERDAWFVFGLKDDELRKFALHRVENEPAILDQVATEYRNTAKEETSIDFGAFPIQVLLDCKPEVRNLVYETPIHKTQTVVSNNNNGVRIALQLVPDEELISKLLSYSGQVEIVSPDKLRIEFAKQLHKMLAAYTGNRA